MTKYYSLGFKTPLRAIESESEIQPNECGLKVYGFSKQFSPYPQTKPREIFHVCRREVDGTWVHKPNLIDEPCIVENWQDLETEYGPAILFAVLCEETG